MHDWITTPITAGLVRGARGLERTEVGVLPHRLPRWARRQYDDPQLEMVEAQPSGVRFPLVAVGSRHVMYRGRVGAGVAGRAEERSDEDAPA